MPLEDLLAAAAKQGSTPTSSAQREEDYQGLRLPPIHVGSPNSTSSLPPQLQRLAFSPEEAASHQRQSSSTSSLDEHDLFGATSGSKLSTLAALSAMEGWPSHPQPHRQHTLPSLTSEYTAATATLPSSSHSQSSRSAYSRYPPPISVPSSAPTLHWPTSQPYPSHENGSRSLPSTTAPFSSYPTAGPSSAPPRAYDVSESIIESVEHLRRRQQAMLLPGGETDDGYSRFAPRSQRACVNCQKAKKRCVPTESGMRPCDRCVRLRLQATCSDAPRKSDFDSTAALQQSRPHDTDDYSNTAANGRDFPQPTWNQP